MRIAALSLGILLAGCAGMPPLANDHPANPAAPAGSIAAPAGLDGYLAPDALMRRADAAARAPRAAAAHAGH